MKGREFLDYARSLLPSLREVAARAVVIHAYYGLFLECRDALRRWQFVPPRRENVHTWVRFRFAHAGDRDLQVIGAALADWSRERNFASYDLKYTPSVSWLTLATEAVTKISVVLALLDQIDGDPARRQAAVATITP